MNCPRCGRPLCPGENACGSCGLIFINSADTNGLNQNMNMQNNNIIDLQTNGSSQVDGNNLNQNICLAFTVDDIEEEYRKILNLGMEIIDKPIKRPWGATNMSFYDPDRNIIYLRSFE